MKLTKGDKTIEIPGWMLLIGAIIVDNTVTNLIRLNALKSVTKNQTEES